MRIVTWNCAGALRRKTAAIDALGADILVVQECENPATSDSGYADWAGNYVWTGAIKHKGIGVFARHGVAIEELGWNGDGLAHFLPVRIGGRLDLLAVWTQPVVPSTYSYIGQFWQYLQRHRAAFGPDLLICGDFNSNAIWDRKRGTGTIRIACARSARPGWSACIISRQASLRGRRANRPSSFTATRQSPSTSTIYSHTPAGWRQDGRGCGSAIPRIG